MDASNLELIRFGADIAATVTVGIGLPLLGRWGVRKGLIQQRWETMIEAAAGAALSAGRAAGPIDSLAFRKAAEQGILTYAKSQAPDVLASKGMLDDEVIQAGLARLSKLTDGAVGPVVPAVAALAPAT